MTTHATLNAWMYGALAGYSGLTALVGGATTPRLYAHLIPLGAGFPCVVWTLQDAGSDVLNANKRRMATNVVVTVQAVAQGTSFAAAETVAVQIEAALAAASRSSGVVACDRVSVVAYTEVSNGVQYVHQGFTYEAVVM